MTQYNDLYIRDNFNDTGTIPTQGDLYISPDIIPYQNEALTWAVANTTYPGPDIGRAIINGGINNIYIRAKNLGNAAGSGTVNLYYTDMSLNLCQTNLWVPLASAGGVKNLPFVDGSGQQSIAPGSVAISNPSFLLTGLPPGPHYCTIAMIQTAAHPVPLPPTFASNAAFVQWVQNNPAVGWRNLTYAPNTFTQISRTFRFGNVNLSPENFVVIITGQGFVKGTMINSQCTDASCPINDNQPLPAPDTYGNQTISFVKNGIPANFWGDLVVTATSPSGPFPSGASLAIDYYQIPDSNDTLEMSVARRYIVSSGAGADAEFRTAALIKVGECTIRVTDNLFHAEW